MFEQLEKEIPFFIKNFSKSLSGYSINDGVIIIEVPGFSKEDLKISLDNYVMHVTGSKKILGESFEIDKKFALPGGSLSSDDPITAKVENGLLFVNLKKSTRAKQTTVDIS